MYKNVTSCVLNNGYSSQFFSIQRGIRQGCPLSALLFILAVEILSIEIRANQNIKGVTINNVELKLTQLADDTTLFLKDMDSLHNALNTLTSFYKCSGLKLNYAKTEILPLGNPEQLENSPINIVTKARSLGILYYNNTRDIEVENHTGKLLDLEHTLNTWKTRKLTIIGRSTVIKTLIVPKINHVISTLNTPEWFISNVQEKINSFLWEGKPPKIKNSSIQNTAEMGGLKYPNINLLVKSQKLSWIKRITLNQNAAWMQLLYTFLSNMNLLDYLKCSIDPKRLTEDIPTFYRQIFYAWFSTLQEPQNALDIRRQILWFNKYIKIDNKTLYIHNLYNKGVVCINDLLVLNNTGIILG